MEENITNSANFQLSYNYKDLPVIAISIFGAISNILLLFAFIKDPVKCFKNSATYLVMNLSVSDCLICFLSPFQKAPVNGSLMYSIFDFLLYSSVCASVGSILSLSVDRFP